MANTTKPEGYYIVELSQGLTTRDYQPGETFYVYGSPMRPISGTWARIPNAVYMTASTFYPVYTFVIVPGELDQSIIDSYELKFMYGPIVYQPTEA